MEPKREDIDSSTSKDNLLYGKYVGQGVDVSEGNVTQKVFNKKGQVTIFIIVGIIILVAAAAVFFVTRSTVVERLTAEGEPVIAQVPQEFAPLQQFTDNCLTDVGKQGLLLLGEQGGYIYPNLVGEYSASDPTDADGIDLEPLKVPYWHYNKEPNNGNKIVFSSLQPKLYASEDKEMSVEAQLGRFVNEKLEGCLQGYQAIKKQGYGVEVLSLPDVEVHVTDDYVQFWLKFDVEASRGESKHSLDTFFVKVPLKLKKYYELAEQITKAEQNYSFLERQGLDLIEIYSGVDPEKLPPTTAATFELVPTVYWTTADIKEKMRQLLVSSVPLLRLANSDNFYRYAYPVSDLSGLYQKSYDTMILPLQGEDLDVGFDYFAWEPYLLVNDKNGVVQPTHAATHYQLLHFGTQSYNTLYDVSYPVLVTIHDEQALNGEGYSFIFSLESNIRNNEPSKADQVILPSISSFSSTMACDKDKYTTDIVRTVVVDSYTKEPLENVQIGFTIPEQDSCIMGLTNENGVVESKYPAVYGGTLSIIKPEYLTSFYPLDTYKLKGKSAVIGYATAVSSQPVVELHKYKTIKATVKKKNIEKCVEDALFGKSCYFSKGLSGGGIGGGIEVYKYTPELLSSTHSWTFTNILQNLNEQEQAAITLTRIGDWDEQGQSEQFGTMVAITANSEQEIQLVPGVYEVSGTLTSTKEIVIPEEERCGGGILGFGEDCFTLEELIMDKVVKGQIQWDAKETHLVITPEQLYSSNVLQFYLPNINIENVPPQEHIRVVEDLQMMGSLSNISQLPEVRQALEPTFR